MAIRGRLIKKQKNSKEQGYPGIRMNTAKTEARLVASNPPRKVVFIFAHGHVSVHRDQVSRSPESVRKLAEGRSI